MEIIIHKLKSYEGDFVVALDRANELFFGFVEGISINKQFSLSKMVKVITVLFTQFGSFLKIQEENKLKFLKIENDVDSNFFATAQQREIAQHQANFKIQEGAAAGKSIC